MRTTFLITLFLFLLFSAPMPNPAWGMVGTNGLSCQALPPLMSAFSRAHISDKSIGPKLAKIVADQFVKHLDPSKGLLLQGEAKTIRRGVINFFKGLRKPNCTELNSIKDILLRRSKEQLAYVRSILNNKRYKLNENVEIITDSKKRKRAKTRQENEKQLLKQIHFQISNYLLNDMKLKKAKKKLVHRYELLVKRSEEFSYSDLYDTFLNAYATSLDPHSSYLSKEVLEDFQITMSLSLEGIGAALVSEDGYTVIKELLPGGAAIKSKQLKVKDKILAVGQGDTGPLDDVVDMELRNVVKKIRGKQGSKVRLRLMRERGGLLFTVTLVRSKIILENDAAKTTFRKVRVGDKELKLAHLVLPSFYGDAELKKRSSYRDMLKAIELINREKVDGVLLDFSRNGGGRLEEAVRISGIFFKQGNVVTTMDSRKRIMRLKDEDKRTQYNGPLAILTSRFSASASEIVAGALKNYKRALIIGGDHTYGKGSVQAVLPLPNITGGAIKVTTGLFFTPAGESTQHKGVQADIPLPSFLAADEVGEKYLDNSLPYQSISPFFSKKIIDRNKPWKPVKNKEIATLRRNSSKRIAINTKFQELKKEIVKFRKNKGLLRLAEVRKESLKRRKKSGKKDEEDKDKENQPHVDEALSVLADFVALRRGWKGKKIKLLSFSNTKKK